MAAVAAEQILILQTKVVAAVVAAVTLDYHHGKAQVPIKEHILDLVRMEQLVEMAAGPMEAVLDTQVVVVVVQAKQVEIMQVIVQLVLEAMVSSTI
jgi:hypothetical protein